MTGAAADGGVLSVSQIEDYISSLKSICHDTPVIDCHVHATEVIRDKLEYSTNCEPVLSAVGFDNYKKPRLNAARITAAQTGPDRVRQNRLSEMAFTQSYRYTGATVLRDQMELAGVDRAVLLPVAHQRDSLNRQMQIIDSCCALDSCFIPGFSIDNAISDDDIADHLESAVRKHAVRVVKVHANVSGINLSEKTGRRRVNAILRACDPLDLPLVFHGGCSPILGDGPDSKFSIAENLREIDWGATRSAVVIAHFGVYGCDGSSLDISRGSVGHIQDILDDHSNVYLDTSGVMFPAIRRMLEIVDPSRVVFGSDAMYVPMYRQIAFVMHALAEAGVDLNIMRTIASQNAIRIFNLPADLAV